MAKVLLTLKNIEEHICRETSSVYLDKDIIILSGAKDYLQNIGISIHYGPRPVKVTNFPAEETRVIQETTGTQGNGKEDIATLTRRIVAILKEEYQVKDEETLQELCLQVVKKMNI